MAIGVGLVLMFMGQGLHFCAGRSSDPGHSSLCRSFGWLFYFVGLLVVVKAAWT